LSKEELGRIRNLLDEHIDADDSRARNRA